MCVLLCFHYVDPWGLHYIFDGSGTDILVVGKIFLLLCDPTKGG